MPGMGRGCGLPQRSLINPDLRSIKHEAAIFTIPKIIVGRLEVAKPGDISPTPFKIPPKASPFSRFGDDICSPLGEDINL
jgi:hypothetical protein